jgi:anti-anti-sigma regulatory factor
MSDLIGKSIVTVYTSLEDAKETNRKLYAGGGVVRDHESRGKTKTGKIIPVRISASHLKDSSGRYTGSVGFFETYRPWTAAEAQVKAHADEIEAKLEELKKVDVPVFELYPGLSMVTVIGNLDVDRWDWITANLLSHVEGAKSRVILIDLSAALVTDNNVASQIVKTIRTIHLLGAKCLLAGLQISVARVMESLMPDVSSVMSFSSVGAALEAALNHIGFDICRRS